MSSRQLRVRVRRGRSRNTSDHGRYTARLSVFVVVAYQWTKTKGEHFGSHSKHRAVVVKGELGERPVLRVYCGPKVKAANVPKACQQLLTYVMVTVALITGDSPCACSDILLIRAESMPRRQDRASRIGCPLPLAGNGRTASVGKRELCRGLDVSRYYL